jgi:hypothetical protein
VAVHSDAGDSEQVSDLLHGPFSAVVELLRERGLLGSTANLSSNAAPDRAHLADLMPPAAAGDQCRTRTGADRPARQCPAPSPPGQRSPAAPSLGD